MRRRFASLIALALTAAVSGCGDVVLPNEGKPAAITIVSGNAQSAPAGVALAQPLVVRVVDALGRPVERQTVTFVVDAGGGQVSPPSAQTGPTGEASATWTLGGAAGQQRVQAQVSGDGLPQGLLVSFNATAVSGAGSQLVVVSGDNQTAAVGSALPDSLVVRVTDALSNPVAGVEVHWAVSGGGSISPETVVSDAQGLAAAERVLGSASGTQTAEASSTGLTPVTFTHTAEAANPTALVLISGDGQTAPGGATLAESLVVRLVDGNGNGVGRKAVTWVVATGGGSVSPVNVTTSPTGLAKTSWTLGNGTGSNLLNAVFSGLPSVPFTATGIAGSATKLGFIQAPVTTTAGTSITPAIKVAIQDAAGNTVTSASDAVTLAIGNNPAGGTLSGTLTVGAVNGVATFSNLSIDKAGDGYTLTAAAGGLTSAASPGFDIVTGSANRLVFIVGPTNVVVGQRFSPGLQVQVQDAGGNPVPAATAPITLTSSITGTIVGAATQAPVLGTATFNNVGITRAGTDYTLTALASGISSTTSAPFDVAQASTTIRITSKTPNGSSVFGQQVTFAYDINVVAPGAGNLTGTVTVTDGVDSCNGPVNAGTGSGLCQVLFTSTGTRSVTATYNGDQNFTGSVSDPVSHTVNKANTTLSITSDTPEPSAAGDVVDVHWTLVANGAGAGVPTGTVTISVNNGPETCTAPAAFGSHSCQITLNTVGNGTLIASYPGDANFNAPSNDNEPHNVVVATTTTIASNLNPSVQGDDVTFTAHVSSAAGTPTGTVRFLDGVTQIGSDNLDGAGNATFDTNDLAQGSHSITAAYQGASGFAASTSSALTQTVNPPSNVPPSASNDAYTMLEDGTLNENAGNGVLKNDDDPDHGPETQLKAQNASDPARGSVSLSDDGSFTYTPDADFNDTDSFTYEAFDGAAATTATVTITITAVNDAPSFTPGGDVSQSAAGGPFSQSWATNGSPGPANESAQTLNYVVTVEGLGSLLFSTQPAIAADGTLTFTPSGTLTGDATVHVRLEDSGGTANGGVDSTGDQTFTISITT